MKFKKVDSIEIPEIEKALEATPGERTRMSIQHKYEALVKRMHLTLFSFAVMTAAVALVLPLIIIANGDAIEAFCINATRYMLDLMGAWFIVLYFAVVLSIVTYFKLKR